MRRVPLKLIISNVTALFKLHQISAREEQFSFIFRNIHCRIEIWNYEHDEKISEFIRILESILCFVLPLPPPPNHNANPPSLSFKLIDWSFYLILFVLRPAEFHIPFNFRTYEIFRKFFFASNEQISHLTNNPVLGILEARSSLRSVQISQYVQPTN